MTSPKARIAVYHDRQLSLALVKALGKVKGARVDDKDTCLCKFDGPHTIEDVIVVQPSQNEGTCWNKIREKAKKWRKTKTIYVAMPVYGSGNDVSAIQQQIENGIGRYKNVVYLRTESHISDDLPGLLMRYVSR